MRTDVNVYAHKDIHRQVSVELWKDQSVFDLLTSAGTPTDLSNYCTSVKMTESKLSVSISYMDEFTLCTTRPAVGDILSVKADGVFRFIGIVDSISGYVEERGERSLSVEARSRDGVGGWKTLRGTTTIFPLGTSLTAMMKEVVESFMQLEEEEIDLPILSITAPHGNSQFADQTPWSMLEDILFAAHYAPYVNVLNQVSAYITRVDRETVIFVDTDRVIKFDGSKESLATGRVRLRWLEPNLKKAKQQKALLYSTAMTTGFFQKETSEEVWWSADHTQRAEDVTFKIVESVNAGLVPVADEDWDSTDEFHGEIVLKSRWYVEALVALVFALEGLASVPDFAPLGGGPTVPTGRIGEAVSTVLILTVMMSIGVGRYELYGALYDWVHATNTTLAYAENKPSWAMAEEELNSSLIQNEEHAQSVAAHYLAFKAASSSKYGVTLVDDPRVEKGDILEFEDGSRLMVTEFSNDFTRGAEATIKVSGVRL